MPGLDEATRQERRKKAGEYLKMADKLFRAADFEGAMRLVQNAMEADPNNPYAAALVLFSLVWLLLAHLFVVLFEEPGLEQRFGGSYAEYKKTVNRFAQGAMRVHLRKTKVGHRRRLESPQNPVSAHAAGAEFFQQLNRCGDRHNQMI